MTLKAFALVTLAAAGLASATVTAADTSYFSFQRNLDERTTLPLGVVRSEGPGTVSIYDYHKAERGDLLGTTSVRQGANYDVRVTLGEPARRDVLAVLTVNGQTVATREYIIDTRSRF